MFVSVVLDPGGQDSAQHLAEVLATFGFEKVQRACWESKSLNDQILTQLKQELDRVTDYYDSIRIYQFPVDGVMAITVLQKKSWKRIVVRPPASGAVPVPKK
jgi:CRISPR-associated protein Cas2